MGNKLTINNRVKIGFAFAIVFLLVLATNRLDKRRFDRLNQSLTTVYEDRLVAKGYLYKLNSIFIKQEKVLLSDTISLKNLEEQKKIEQLIADYRATKLTNEERSTFNELQKEYEKLKRLTVQHSESNSANTKSKIKLQLNHIQNNLDDLAEIQLSEGESLTRFAQSSFDTSDTMSKIEIAVILLIGIVVQFIIFKR